VRKIEVALQVRLRSHHDRDRRARRSDGVPSSAAQVREAVVAEAVRVAPCRSWGRIQPPVADSGVAATVLCTKKHLSKVVFLSGGSVVAERSDAPRLAVLCALSGFREWSRSPGSRERLAARCR